MNRRRHSWIRGHFGLIEPLEPRRLLAIASLPTDLLDRIEQRLWDTAQSVLAHRKNQLLKDRAARVDSSNRIQAYVHTTKQPSLIVSSLTKLGARITEVVGDMKVVEAFIPANGIDRAARLAGVNSITLPDYAMVNNVTSEGDSVLKADKVRSQFQNMGIDGSGIKIGVISDGVTHRNNVGSELPSITIDPSHTGSGDEGTAMLEIVHDLAPGADLYFSGPSSSAAMVSSINYLVAQGCNVIIDDLSFFGESYFSDSSVANAAASAVSSGVVYVTSAGNYSQQHYQAQYVQSTSAFGGGRLHRFASGDNSNDVTIFPNQRFRAFLQWSDEWGASGNNYDLYLINGDTFATIASSVSVQNGNDNPYESIDWTNNTGSTVDGQLWIVKKTGAATRELELFTPNNSSMQFQTSGDSLISQEAVTSVMSVAASSASSPTNVESYSSRGGSTIYTDFSTQTKTIRQSLDGTATDGVQTSVGQQNFFNNPFFGTSAAAPHAGAIAALIRQVDPSLTPADVLDAMANTATDIGSAGYDTSSGAGLYNALDAVYSVFKPATPNMSSFSDHGLSNSDDFTNDNTPTFNGTVPAGSYVRLFVDGVQIATTQLSSSATSYSLTPGGDVPDGVHSATIRVASSSSTPLVKQSILSGELSFEIDTVAPTISPGIFQFAGPEAQSLSFDFSESVAGCVQPWALDLFNQTTNQHLSHSGFSVNDLSGTTVRFSFPGYQFGSLPDGKYAASIDRDSITDIAGNQLAAGCTFNFFFLSGDANRDGKVDSADLAIFSQNWQGTNKTFTTGDFNYDGRADITDLYLLANNWQKDLFA